MGALGWRWFKSFFGACAILVFCSAPLAASPLPSSFADLVAKLLPAVVNVATTQTLQPRGGEGQGQPQSDPQPGLPPWLAGPDGADSPTDQIHSLGTGFIIDPSGVIVTNNHVVAGANTTTVTLQDGSDFKAVLIGQDKLTDLAVLKINAGHPLPFVRFGDSTKLRVGDWVIAIGNPFGLGGTVTAGIISARGRDIEEGPYDNFIQTDAPINRGNSGGPLFDVNGDVIGVNTAIFSPSGGSVGIGFAIPSELASIVVRQLREYGHPRRGWLGVSIQEVTSEIAQSLGLPHPEGALIASILSGGPAAKSKLRSGDVILRFNNRPVTAMHELPWMVAETTIGKRVTMEIWRDGKQEDVTVTVAEMPRAPQLASLSEAPPMPKAVAIAEFGLTLSAITPELALTYHLDPATTGVVVTRVDSNRQAAQFGLVPGDVIVEVQQHPVTTPAEVETEIGLVRRLGRPAVLILVQHGTSQRWVALTLAPG